MTDWFLPSRFHNPTALTWCSNCEEQTALDGWGMSLSDNAIELFCAACGKIKDTLAYEDASKDLQSKIALVAEWKLR